MQKYDYSYPLHPPTHWFLFVFLIVFKNGWVIVFTLSILQRCRLLVERGYVCRIWRRGTVVRKRHPRAERGDYSWRFCSCVSSRPGTYRRKERCRPFPSSACPSVTLCHRGTAAARPFSPETGRRRNCHRWRLLRRGACWAGPCGEGSQSLNRRDWKHKKRSS